MRQIAALPESAITSLSDALASERPTSAPELTRKLSEKVSIDKGTLAPLMVTLISLEMTRESRRTSTEKFVDEVVQAALDAQIFTQTDDDAALANTSLLRSRLSRLLGLPALQTSAKLTDVSGSYGTVFRNARIITDIRPVFGNGPEKLVAATLVHHLELTTIRDGEITTDYVAMTVGDIRKFATVIERAMKKEPTLKAALAMTPMEYIDNDDSAHV